MTRITFVIGNGDSRQPIDLELCKQHGLTIGCNAIVRDFHPHIVSAADERMLTEITSTAYTGQLYTRSNWNNKHGALPYPALPYDGKIVQTILGIGIRGHMQSTLLVQHLLVNVISLVLI